MNLKPFYAKGWIISKAWVISDPRILYRILRGAFRAVVLRKNTLRTIDILPTFDCQAKCKMCGVTKFKRRKENLLTLADYESIAEQAAKMGAVAATLLGGEPLLAKNIEDVIRIFKSRHFSVALVSNGIALTRDYARRLRSAGLDWIHFSLESLDEKFNDERRGFPGQSQKVMEAIRMSKDEGLPVGLCTLFVPGEMDRCVELIEYCEKNDLRASLPTIVAVGAAEDIVPASEEHYQQVLGLLKRYRHTAIDWAFSYFFRPRCPAGKEKLAITCYGDVLGCSLNHISFGNVKQEPLRKIWERAGRFSQFRKNTDRCIAAFDRYHIENYLSPIAHLDESPVYFKDHPNITVETEPALFSE